MSPGSKADSHDSAPPPAPEAGGRSAGTITVCVIGDLYRREFSGVQQRLIDDDRLQIFRRYDSIQQAIAEPDGVQEAQLTIVLQSWSEQFARRDIHHLIGLTFASRLICFGGPWCESDGRNHDLWPDAIRIPLRESSTAFDAAYQQIQQDEEHLPVTAAKDEVFAARVPQEPSPAFVKLFSLQNAAVIGPDTSLRRTVASLLKSIGVRTAVRNLVAVAPYQTIAPVQTPRGPIHLVFHDLDPFGQLIQESLEGCQQMFPDGKIIGLANMPDAGLMAEIADIKLAGVLAKSNLLADLQRWMLSASQATEQS